MAEALCGRGDRSSSLSPSQLQPKLEVVRCLVMLKVHPQLNLFAYLSFQTHFRNN